MSPFEFDYDTCLQQILTDYRNLDPSLDLAKGSTTYVKAAALASCVWGLYRSIAYNARQILPGTADDVHLARHAGQRGIVPRPGESVEELRSRVLAFDCRPPAGGNKYDYERWALEVDGVKSAWCLPCAQGVGSVDIVISAKGDSEIPDQTLIHAVFEHIDNMRPVRGAMLRVLPPVIRTVDIEMVVYGAVNRASFVEQVRIYMSSLGVGEQLALSRLMTLAVNAGASDACVNDPETNVIPDEHEIIRPGEIHVA